MMPPAFAEWLLRRQLAIRDRDTVSGDMLEMYRDRLDEFGSMWRADVWYWTEVARLTWMANGQWVVLYALAELVRTALDWFLPTTDFAMRSTWTTAVSVGLLFVAGMSTAWRVRSISSAALTACIATIGGGLIHGVGALALLAARHDPATLAAIRGSGGLAEALTLPMFIVLPAVVIGGIGGGASSLLRGLGDILAD
jgi:hypothetical protein